MMINNHLKSCTQFYEDTARESNRASIAVFLWPDRGVSLCHEENEKTDNLRRCYAKLKRRNLF